MIRVSEGDWFGRFYFQSDVDQQFSGYYVTLDLIRPLLEKPTWKENITGYYINVFGEFNRVRLSYFSPYVEIPKQITQEFIRQTELVQMTEIEEPCHLSISDGYGGEELRFRRFLSTYTRVGLDIMAFDLTNSRRLLAVFRWQIMRARMDYQSFFQGTFTLQSPFFRAMTEQEKRQFWLDLNHWPNPLQVDWAHFLVNMVLGCDWNSSQIWPLFLEPRPPLTIPEINHNLQGQDFEIPKDWHPA